LPDGQNQRPHRNLSSPASKNISLFPKPKSDVSMIHPVPTRGAFRDRHERGMGCGGRGGIDETNDAGCGRRSRVVLMPRRWHQVRQAIDERQWQKSPVTGESTKETVKTIARETPGCPGEPVVTNSPCFIYFRTRGCGCIGTRRFPRPLFSEAKDFTSTRALIAQ
jgi:hypothetical protein